MERAPLLLACAAVFLDAAGYGIVVPTVPLRASDLHLSSSLLGLVFAAYPLVHLVVTLPLGLLCDRWGRKPVLVLGMLVLAVSSLSFSLSSSFLQLFVSRGIQGMAAASTWVASLALLTDLTPSCRRGRTLGWVTASMGLGAIAGPPLGGWTAEVGGYPTPFRFWALLSLLLALLSLAVLREPPHSRLSNFRSSSFLGVVRNPDALLSCLVALVIWMGFGFLEPFAPPYLSSHLGLGQGEIGMMFGLAALFLAASRPVFGSASDRFGRRRVIGWGMLFCSASFPVVLFVGSPWQAAAVFCLLGLAIGIPLSSALPLITEAVPEAGTASALFLMAYSVGHVVGPVVGGAVLSTGDFALLLFPYSLLSLVLGLLSLRGLRR
ncbi:MAG: MFS transporter [Candidatus Hadarchaeales archaeon]